MVGFGGFLPRNKESFMRKLLIGLVILGCVGLGAFQISRSMAQHPKTEDATVPSSVAAGSATVPQATASASSADGSEQEMGVAETQPMGSGASGSDDRAHQKPLAGSPFEASLLTDGALNSHSLKLLEAKDFEKVLDELDAQNAGRSNDIVGKYRGQIESTLQSFGKNMQLDRLVCGVNVCMGTIRAAQNQSFNDWYEGIQTASVAPMGALSEYPVQLPGGGVEHRLLFTTDPRSAAVIVPPMPRKS